MHNSLPICRVCLKTSLEYIDFETPFDDSCTYLECFRKCTRLDFDLVNNATTPAQSLCDNCAFELKIAYDFLQRAEKADYILRDAMLQNQLDEMKLEATDNEECPFDKVEEDNDNNGDAEEEIVYECGSCQHTFLSQSLLNLHSQNCTHSEAAPNKPQTHETDYETPFITTATEEDNDINQETKDEEHLEHSNNREENLQLEMLEELNDEEFEDAMDDILNDTEDNETMTTTATKKEEMQQASVTSQNCDTATELAKHKDFTIKKSTLHACTVCDHSFNTRAGLMRHHNVAHQTLATNTCKICLQKVVGRSEEMRTHLEQMHSAIVQCNKCNYKGKESRLPEHERRAHSTQRDFLCNVCSKTFTSSSLLNAHLKNHDRKKSNVKSDACEVCGKQFSTQHYLRQHMDVHREERELHQCTDCDKIYYSKTALENHMRVHKGDKVVECPWCGKIFARQYELTVHKRFHTRDYPFACEMCGKKFAIKGHLRTHMWRHQGLKLQCEECGKLFTSTKALSEHSFSHTEMPFPCSYCAKGYPSKQKYKVHLKTIHFIELTEEELQKVVKAAPKPLLRKKLTLVQADSVMKEVEINSKEDYEDAGFSSVDTSEILVEFC